MSLTRWKTGKLTDTLFGLALVLSLALAARPAAGTPDDADRDMKGFDSTMVRQEKALRAVVKGKSYFEDGSLDKARECFNEALVLNADLHEARFCLGQIEVKDKKYKLAIAHFMSVYERYPQYKQLRLELARTWLAAGDCEQAGIWLKRHLEISKADKSTNKLKRQIEECSNRRENKS